MRTNIKNSSLIIIVSIIIISLSIFFINKYSKESKPEFSYSFVQEKKEDIIYFKHEVYNMGDKQYPIEFLTNIELEYTVLNLDGDLTESFRKIDKANKNKPRIVTLKPQEILKNEIKIPVGDLPAGKYRILAKLSTANIDTPTFRDEFEIK
ncbi:hypothetical protein [Sutcliffiella cohnii]|uniref:hypothetical protein n=1 Tax=Sutcliffiella cohnii TaxID=33932 RepID=UPI002E1BCA7F|nr:hypothetical protein [Sutcliffiella cohnii]